MDKLFLIMDIGQTNGFCTDSANIWQVVGYVLLVFKIVIPIILIILGMLDLGKAVVASKDDEIKKSMKSLMFRAIAAVAIFFIPTLIGIVLGLVSNFSDKEVGVEEDYIVCRKCITNPRGSECSNKASNANKN